MTVGQPRVPSLKALLLLLISMSGCTVGNVVSDSPHHPIQGRLIGAQLTALGLSSYEKAGVSALDERTLLRWETVQHTPIVTGIATAWSAENQTQYIRSGSCLSCLADELVRLWAPPDTAYVSEHRLGVGGTALFAYRSESLRETFDNQSDSGDIYVVIVLDTVNDESDVPIVAPRFAGQNDLGNALFSVALISGRPWGKTKL